MTAAPTSKPQPSSTFGVAVGSLVTSALIALRDLRVSNLVDLGLANSIDRLGKEDAESAQMMVICEGRRASPASGVAAEVLRFA